MAKQGKKNRYWLVDTMVQLFAKGLDKDKKVQIRDKIAAYVCNAEQVEQFRRIDEILIILMKKFQKRPEAKDEIADKLLDVIAEQLFEREQLEMFLHIGEKLLDADLTSVSQKVQSKNFDHEVLLTTGHVLFDSVLFQVAGSSVEKSCQLGLFLLECYRDFRQEIENSRKLTEGIDPLDEKARQDIQRASPKLDALGMKTSVVFNTVHQSFVGPPGRFCCPRLWIDRLIGALDENPVAEELLISLLGFLTSASAHVHGRPNGQLCQFTVIPAGREAEYAQKIKESFFALSREDIRKAILQPLHTVVITQEQLPIIRRFNERIAKEKTKNISRREQMLAWLERQRPWLEEEIQRKRQLIREQPRRGLRPHGADHIDVDVTLLRHNGLRAVVFYPEDHTFPDIRIELLTKELETPHLIALSVEMADLSLDKVIKRGDTSASPDQLNPKQYKLLLEMVIIDILYRIVVEGKELRPKKVSRDTDHKEGPKTSSVRPHLRRLTGDRKASAEAQERARSAMGWHLPSGMTFVAAHYRGNQLVYDYPTEAVGVYSDVDLFDNGRPA